MPIHTQYRWVSSFSRRSFHRLIGSSALLAVAAISMLMPLPAAAQTGDFRVSNFATGFVPDNFWYRGYAFTVARPVEVTHMWGGAGENCAAGFEGGVYEASWSGGSFGAGEPQLDTLLAKAVFNPVSPPAATEEEMAPLVDALGNPLAAPLTLQPDQTYILAQGRAAGTGTGCHYRADSIEVINLLQGSPTIDQWFPDTDAALQFSNTTGPAETVVGAIADTTTPVRVLLGFRYLTDAELPAVETQPVEIISLTQAIIHGNLIDAGVQHPQDQTTLYFEWGQQSDLSDATLVVADDPAGNPVEGPQSNLDFSYQLGGLTTGTTYYYRAIAINEAGRVEGDIVEFSAGQVTLTIEVGSGGSAVPEGSMIVPVGTTEIVTITTDPGFRLLPPSSTCGGELTNDTFTTEPITADCVVRIRFSRAAASVPIDTPWMLALLAGILALFGGRMTRPARRRA